MDFVEQLNKIHTRLVEEERRQAAIDNYEKAEATRIRKGREDLLERILCSTPDEIRMLTIRNAKNGICDQLYALAESDSSVKDQVQEATDTLWNDEADYIFSDFEEEDLGMTL